MKVKRKFSLTRGTPFMHCLTRRLRRLLRNPRQNRPKLPIAHVPAVVAEAILVQVGLQVLGANVVIHAADATLHGAPEAFNGVGVDIAHHIDFCVVADAAMGIAVKLQAVVSNVLIGKHDALGQDKLPRNLVQSLLLYVRRNASDNPARASFGAALDHAHDRDFVIAPARGAAMSTVECFIHFNRRTLQLQTILGQESPNLAEHAPRCFVGDACLPLNLLGGYAATSRAHEIHRIEPSLEGCGALLEDAASQWVDVIAACLARIGCATAHTMMLAVLGAFLAASDTLRPALLFHKLKARVIVRELSVKLHHGVSQLYRDALFNFHEVNLA
jgi:hypothetical protein